MLSETYGCLQNKSKRFPNGIAMVDRLIPPDSVYLKSLIGDSIGTRGVSELDKIVFVNSNDLEDLIFYADMCAGIIKEGWPGKSASLEQRYMKIHDSLEMDRRNGN